MLEDVIRLYFKHQKPPGTTFVERGDYRLVHAGTGSLIEPTKWTYELKSGKVVEMSMVLHTHSAGATECPRCHTKIDGHAKKEWVNWRVTLASIASDLILMALSAHLVHYGSKLKANQCSEEEDFVPELSCLDGLIDYNRTSIASSS